ncbi:DUF6365 family protein [Acetivibrio straminisolvens]|jgi:hypothetical protein|uniref:DUF6365 family protein n=1 Tax=Acetivibrio straminisolvens TaxID=253314 RepID=UPI00223F6ED7|nr:DUF6365 family protein [Acetivibrio straminisolvens]
MKVLFIVTSYWAYGELLIALNFANKIKKSGYQPYFFIPPSHEKILRTHKIPYSLLIPKLGKVNRVLMQDIEHRHCPDYVILSDFLNYYFCEKHYGITVEDLKIFKGKLGTFDNFCWDLDRQGMDTYGFNAKTVSKVDITKFGFRLTPCPIANPLMKNENNKYYYPLLDEFLPYNQDIKIKHRKELNLPQNKRIILITSAVWQETYKAYPHVTNFVNVANKIYRNILTRIAQNNIVLYVGPKGFFEEGNIPSNIHFLGQLSPDVFEKYATASDLFITRNITSTTLAKLALSGIPSVMLKNSLFFTPKTKDKFKCPFKPTEQVEEILNNLEMCYPYRMYPVGWYTFLEPVIKDNPYINVVNEVELFDEERAVDTIWDILENRETVDRITENVARYRGMLDKLCTPSNILEQIGYDEANNCCL